MPQLYYFPLASTVAFMIIPVTQCYFHYHYNAKCFAPKNELNMTTSRGESASKV